MARRKMDLFNLSFLDLLSGALGAVIFLFIITPKGGEGPSIQHQLTVSMDKMHKKVFGNLVDSLYNKEAGDTLLVLITDYQEMPSIKNCPKCPEPQKCPECPKEIDRITYNNSITNRTYSSSSENYRSSTSSYKSSSPKHTPNEYYKPNEYSSKKQQDQQDISKEKLSKYGGTPPSVPCKVSFEIKWADKNDNVNLFVCRGNDCVYGGKRGAKHIGKWDSGLSVTSFFKKNNLRTNQEAVRQIENVIPGRYQLYAQFVKSKDSHTSIDISGLIYTKNDNDEERAKRFYKTLSLDEVEKKRVLIGTVDLSKDGYFKFTKK